MKVVRVIDEQDSLLQLLLKKDRSRVADDVDSSQTSSTLSVSGHKVAKTQQTVMEELRESNAQLRVLVEQLVDELARLRTEKETLESQVASLLRMQSQDQDMHLPPLQPPTLLY